MNKELDVFQREIRKELRDFKKSVDYCSAVCDDIKPLSEEIRSLRKELADARKANDILMMETKKLRMKVEDLEAYTRANNLEIKGVPNEGDPSEVVQNICSAVGEPITSTDIDVCHRMGTKNPDVKNIIVRFVRREKRDAVLAKAKRARLSANKIGFQSTDPIFVNENLTQLGKQLLGATIAKKRGVGWKYVWTRNGKIFARKTESSEVLRIAERDDLEKMCR
ncbi:hypothetical protein HPB51_019595 [Rhipicephalus microplus]|uniref:FP protein C-terminal domain-containing protein n=1 Tax=Rhipicephalus microplus TaxID=6941 RepID=A0A9J6DPF8_RHIMP|nr:hypothetical protein HPB51_015270 [Rhipicephalus microplus]KAH8036190.1 hypothetical protein HPB51_019595 [Rhipicephalus microplus]